MCNGKSAISSRNNVPPSALNESVLVIYRAGKTPALVSKEFAFHEFGRNGAAINGYERTIATGPRLMDQFGSQFLAGSGFSEICTGA